MKILTKTILMVCLLLCFTQCRQNQSADNGNAATPSSKRNLLRSAVEDRISFPDFGYMLSPDKYHGRVFRLSDTYPKNKPVMDDALKNILTIDFKKNWKKYMAAVKAYIFEGNATKDYENSFFLEDNKVRNWYHVPWQHWGPQGREGFHGLTQEGPVGKQMLAPTQNSTTHAYAVGFYNEQGGYGIGKVWNTDEPNYSFLNFEGFPEGTVVGKVLFVPLESNEVPYLENPVSWNAYMYESDIPGRKNASNTARVQHQVNLIQMDIMVKDKRAESTGGWVFGTFVYQGKLNNDNRWENLMPVGIMWGNDPENTESNYNPTPTKTVINASLKETIINDSPDMPAMHLGWSSRLNGPVDNAYSSCMSCHSTAQYPVVSNILPQYNTPPVQIPAVGTNATPEWMKWFRNVPCGTPFDPGQAVSMDYSLQLVKSIQNYIEFASETQKGSFYEEYWSDHKIVRNKLQQ